MSMETDFRALLANDAGVSALVGTHIYPSTYTQGAADPCIRYTKVTGSTGIHMGGSDGLSEATMQVDIRAPSAASAFAVRDAVVAKLHAFSGTQGQTDFRLIKLDADRGSFEKPADTGYYTATLDFTVISRAAA